MNCSFRFSNLGRGPRQASYLPIARPERSLHCPSLIPAGDRYSSRGQRPRKTRPPAGPTLKGSNPGGLTPVLRPACQGHTTPAGSKGRTPRFPGALPPATILCPSRARKTDPPTLHRDSPVSDITDSRSMLRRNWRSFPRKATAESVTPFASLRLTLGHPVA